MYKDCEYQTNKRYSTANISNVGKYEDFLLVQFPACNIEEKCKIGEMVARTGHGVIANSHYPASIIVPFSSYIP